MDIRIWRLYFQIVLLFLLINSWKAQVNNLGSDNRETCPQKQTFMTNEAAKLRKNRWNLDINIVRPNIVISWNSIYTSSTR